jgi:hypothetical protein
MVNGPHRYLLAVGLASFVALIPTRAHAADEFEKARATGLVAEGQALVDAGKLEQACMKFEESVALHASVDNQEHLAGCWERIGRTASAYAAFLKVADKTRELGQTEREKAAADRAHALAEKLTRLRIEVKTPTGDLEVTQNGKPIAREDWGKAIPVDPGKVELCATAPGKQPWREKLVLPAEPVTVLVWVPALADEKDGGNALAGAGGLPEGQSAHGVGKSTNGLRTFTTIGLLGVGATGLVVGSVMSAQYATSNGDAKEVCPSSFGCSEQEIARHERLVEDARTYRTWSLIGFSVGAAGLAGAAVLYFTAPSEKRRADAPWLRGRVFVTREGAVSGALQGGF